MANTMAISLTPEGMEGLRYRSPNGRIWRVSGMDGQVAHLWAMDNLGLIIRAECNHAQLIEVGIL